MDQAAFALGGSKLLPELPHAPFNSCPFLVPTDALLLFACQLITQRQEFFQFGDDAMLFGKGWKGN